MARKDKTNKKKKDMKDELSSTVAYKSYSINDKEV